MVINYFPRIPVLKAPALRLLTKDPLVIIDKIIYKNGEPIAIVYQEPDRKWKLNIKYFSGNYKAGKEEENDLHDFEKVFPDIIVKKGHVNLVKTQPQELIGKRLYLTLAIASDGDRIYIVKHRLNKSI